MFELYLAFVPLEGQKLFLCQSMQEKLPVADPVYRYTNRIYDKRFLGKKVGIIKK